MQALFFISLIGFVNGVCEGEQCCEGGWISNLQYCKQLMAAGKCDPDSCWEFHVKPSTHNNFCCAHRRTEHQAEPTTTQAPVEEAQVVEEPKAEKSADGVCEGVGCCDDQWIDTEKDCKIMIAEGHCAPNSCWAFHVAPATTNYWCCAKPHHAEQRALVEEAQVVEEPKAEKSADGVCEGQQCCDDQWIGNKKYCLQLMAEGKCAPNSCWEFHVAPSTHNDFCCAKPHKAEATILI